MTIEARYEKALEDLEGALDPIRREGIDIKLSPINIVSPLHF